MTSKPVIAVDGPAASGKSSFAKALAQRLDYAYFDTGSVYRFIAREVLKRGGDPSKVEDVKPVLKDIGSLTPQMLEDAALREPEVSAAAPQVAVMPEVREAVKAYQRSFADKTDKKGVVMDGRDIGTDVFPDAAFKFFVTATPEERARRRYQELKKEHPELTPEMVLKDINIRDRLDTTRAIAPLRRAADAHVIDNTHMTPAQSIEAALAIINGKPPAPKKDAGPKLS